MKKKSVIIANVVLGIFLIIVSLELDIAKARGLHEAKLDLNTTSVKSPALSGEVALLDHKLVAGRKKLEALRLETQEL